MSKLDLFTNEIQDQFARENFKRLHGFLKKEPIFKGDFKFFELTGTGTGSFTKTHNLGFMPKDVLTLHVSAGYSVAWDYEDFTRDTVKFTTSVGSGAWTIRAFIGRYEEG